jgi:4-amino-4-deoxy-L-arabinose transferase-like glycosyltransferase
MGKSKLNILFLLLVFGLALVLRLYKINSPVADHHSFRQSDTAAVIRNLATDNFNVFRPQWDNMVATNIQRLPNPNRYFFEDFPIAYDIYPALLYKVFGVQERLARLVSIAFSLGTIVFFFLLVKLLTDFKTAIFSAFFLAVLPFGIFFSRTLLQEPAFLFYLVGSLYFLALWSNFKEGYKRKLLFLFSAVFLALALLTKIYSLFYLPLFLYLFWQKERWVLFKKKYFYFYFLLSLLPALAWWLWIYQFPEGLPNSLWLLNEGNIRLKGAWFYWLFAERIGKIILGYWGLSLFSLGLLLKPVREKIFFYLWFFCVVLFFIVFAKGSVTHDYYQYCFLPVAAFFLAKGTGFLLTAPTKFFSRLAVYFFLPIFILLMLAFSWYEVRGFYDIKGGIDVAGAAVRENVPEKSLVIAGDGSDPTLLYNTGRKGWAIGYGALLDNTSEVISNLKDQGAEYYVTTKIGEIQNSLFGKFMYENFTVVKQTDQYVVFSL